MSDVQVPKIIFEHGGKVQNYHLTGDSPFHVGRSPDNPVPVPEEIAYVSRHHATILTDGKRWYIRDEASKNKTYVNGLVVGEPYEIKDGDRIRLGLFEMTFRAASQAKEPKAKPKEALGGTDTKSRAGTSTRPESPPFYHEEPPGVEDDEFESVAIDAPNRPQSTVDTLDDSMKVSMSIDLGNFERVVGELQNPGVDRGETEYEQNLSEFSSELQSSVIKRENSGQSSVSANRAGLFSNDTAWSIALFSEIGQALLKRQGLGDMLRSIMNQVFKYVPAERAMISLSAPGRAHFVPHVIRTQEGLVKEPFEVSHTVIDQAVRNKTAVLVEDTATDTRVANAASIRLLELHSAICVPLYSQGRVRGVIYADTQNEARAFSNQHLEILTALGLFSAIAIEQAQLEDRASEELRKRERLARYSSPAVVRRILIDEDLSDVRMLADKEDVSVLFADLKGFTSLSERLSPTEVVETLNSVFSLFTEAVFQQSGTLDKFMGDGMLAFFGAPLKLENHALNAVLAAIEMFHQLAQFNKRRNPEDHIGARIGINSGPVIVGDIGSSSRKDYTVIGDTVNVASRLESSVAKPGEIIVGPGTYLSVYQDIECEPLMPAQLKGKAKPIPVYRVVGKNF